MDARTASTSVRHAVEKFDDPGLQRVLRADHQQAVSFDELLQGSYPISGTNCRKSCGGHSPPYACIGSVRNVRTAVIGLSYRDRPVCLSMIALRPN